MPTYGYVCDKCNHEFEIEQCFTDDELVDCPECFESALRRKIYTSFFFVKGEPTTVGHQAARNTERMGRYEYEARMEERQKRIRKASEKALEATKGKNFDHSGELPWWRSGKVEGLPKEERPIPIEKAQKMAKELGINITEPKKKKKV